MKKLFFSLSLLISVTSFAQYRTLIEKDSVRFYTSKYKHSVDSAALKLAITATQTALNTKVNSTRTVTINGTTYDLSADRSWTIATDVGSVVWGSITGTLSGQTDLQNALNDKVDKITGKGLSTEDYTTSEKSKLAGISTGATVNSTDAQLRDRSTHTGQQLASTISDFQSAVTGNTNVTANTNARHSHTNKALLDTYTQTEANLADAVAKKHAHANQTALDNVSGTNTGDETGAGIKTKLEALTGSNRLDYSAIQNGPTGGTVDTSNYSGIQTKPNTIRVIDSALNASEIVFSSEHFAGEGTTASPLTVVGASGSAYDSLRVGSDFSTGSNIYFDTTDHRIHVKDLSNGYVYRLAVQDSTLITSGGGGGGPFVPVVWTNDNGAGTLTNGGTEINDNSGDFRYFSTNYIAGTGTGYEEVYLGSRVQLVLIGFNGSTYYSGLPPYNNFEFGNIWDNSGNLNEQAVNTGVPVPASPNFIGIRRDKATGTVTVHSVSTDGLTWGPTIYTWTVTVPAGARLTGFSGSAANVPITYYARGF